MVCCILLFTALALVFTPVRASDGTILAVDPAATSVPLGNQTQLELIVIGGVKVNAFDVTVHYDSARLALASWAHGDYLKDLSCVYTLNQPGVLQLACTQIARPGVNGDGALLKLVFDTTQLGLADVTIAKAEFADSQGVKSYPERQHGVVDVQNIPVYTNTPTATRTPTATHTSTLTHTPEPTLTATNPPTFTPTMTYTVTATEDDRTDVQPGYPVAPSTPIPEGDGITNKPVDETEGLADPEATALSEGVSTQLAQGDDPATVGEIEGGGSSRAEDEQVPSWLAGLIWGILVLGSAAFIVMLIMVIRRKNKQSEDYLL